ncbi:hypothetical protein V6R85_01560 [Agrobacterium sp. CCNWLW32]|uniref:hypothetical protein n=1 Tax=Agrobacterium sp. CCNWLW32 TaxID=3122072 RepID=UPI00300F891C
MQFLPTVSEKAHHVLGFDKPVLRCSHCYQASIRCLEAISASPWYAIKVGGSYLEIDHSSGYPVPTPHIFMATMWSSAKEATEYAEATGHTNFNVVCLNLSEEPAST